MNTDDLVRMLATGAGPVQPGAAARRFSVSLGSGVFVAALLMAIFLGVRPDLADAALLPMFWVKLAFVACLAAASLPAALRLSRPGVPLAWVPGALAVPVLAMWILAGAVLIAAEPARRAELFLGDTWASCPINIALLSAPVFASASWAMKGFAPTRLSLAGAAAGLVSGATGALVYSLHCPELAAPFLGFWYLLGILIPTAVGALLGPRLLRW